MGESNPFEPEPRTVAVPLFPLPNVVLFPRAVLPLHIFEERYKEMTRDVLAGPRQVAMALLKSGWEKNYYGRAVIEPVVCVGRILTAEELPDGRFNFLLQGMKRARLVAELPAGLDPTSAMEELDDWPQFPPEAQAVLKSAVVDGTLAEYRDKPYRVGLLETITDTPPDPAVEAAGRAALDRLFNQSPLGQTPLGAKFCELTRGDLPIADLVDLVSFNFVEDLPSKQLLLAETDVSRRLTRLLAALTGKPSVSESISESMSVRLFKNPGLN